MTAIAVSAAGKPIFGRPCIEDPPVEVFTEERPGHYRLTVDEDATR